MNIKILSLSQEFLSNKEIYEFRQKYDNVNYKRIPLITELSKVYSLDEHLAIKSHSTKYKLISHFSLGLKYELFEQIALEKELNQLENMRKIGFNVPKPLATILVERKGIKKILDNVFEKYYLLLEHKGGSPSLNFFDSKDKLVIANLIENEKNKLQKYPFTNYNPSIENSLYNPETKEITFFGITKTQRITSQSSYKTLSQPGFRLVTK